MAPGWVWATGSIALAAWVAVAAAGDLSRRVPLFLLLIGIAFAAYALLLVRSCWGERLSRGAIRLVLLGAVLFRAVMLTASPSLSDDIYRYIWDGRVLAAGINPFRHAPAAEELTPLRDTWHARINHPEIPTIYPPAAQLVFAGAALVHPHPLTVKTLMAAIDLGLIGLLLAVLRRLGLPRGRVLVYAWCPLPVLEFAGMGHVDVLAVALLVGAHLALESRRYGVAMSALGLAVLAKLLPLLAAPLLLQRTPRRWWLLFVAVPLVGYLPFVAGGVDPTVGLRTYLEHWRGNEALFGLLVPVAGSFTAAKVCAAALVAATLVAGLVGRRSPWQTCLWVLAAAILLAPVVHPWYVTWLLPWLCVVPVAGLVLLSGSILLAYRAWEQLHGHGSYVVTMPNRLAEYVPVAVLLVWQRVRGRRP